MPLPDGWRMARLGQLGRFFKASGGTKADTSANGVRCVRYGELYSTYGTHIRQVDARVAEEAADKYTELERGDVLFAASGETLDEIGKSAALMTAETVVGGGDLIVLRPNGEVDPEFLGYATNSAFARAQKYGLGRGVTVMHIYGSGLKTLTLPLPPRSDQHAIAAYLNRETRQIDELIAQKERLLDLLDDQRTSLISEVVTTGLDPDAPMKDSGMEWAGMIPAHWDVVALKRVARLESGHTPSRSHPEYWEDCRHPWFSLADVWQVRDGRREWVYETAELVSDLGLANSSARMLPAGTVMLSRTASVGFSAIMGVPMATTQDFANWVPGKKIRSEFLLYLLRGMRPEFRRLTMGSTHKTIYMPEIRELRGLLPPVHEQDAIIAGLRSLLAPIDALTDATRSILERLSELRTSLISEAVTGRATVEDGAEERTGH